MTTRSEQSTSNTDYLQELELLGVPARLKRLSDSLSTSIKELYRSQRIDIEPSWHLVFLFLKGQSASQSELAESLHLSLPAVTTMVQRMSAKGYLDVTVDKEDGRRRVVALTSLARRRLPKFERIWKAGQAAVGELLGTRAALLAPLAEVEDRLREREFFDRAAKHLKDSPRT